MLNLWGEKAHDRDKCFQGSDPVFRSIRGSQLSIGSSLLTVGTLTADQNYFIPKITLAATSYANTPGTDRGYVVHTVVRGAAVDDGDVLGGIGLAISLNRLASLYTAAGSMGESAFQDFHYHPYGIYLPKGAQLRLMASVVINGGTTVGFVSDAIFMCVPTFT